MSLFHPQTQWRAGLAQLILQIAIVSPAFWSSGFAADPRRLIRILWIIFICNAVGTLAGLLQIYYPATFLPAEFSNAASADWLRSMTFVSPGGLTLVRPPGLSDLPGGAAMAASLTAIFGFAFSSLRSTTFWVRSVCFLSALGGLAVLYLTQVRSLTLMTMLSLILLTALGLRNGVIWNRGWMAAAAVMLILGAFSWAVAAGGEHVRDRFLRIRDEGVISSFETNRGWSWRYTFGEALDKYPLGAGLGRWGMMSVYFGDAGQPDSPPLWAEIQMTGWLYDGGIPMWLLYGGALAASMRFLYKLSRSSRCDHVVSFAAMLAFCANCNIIGASLSGPAFNTSMGIEYWMLVALVYGAARANVRHTAGLRAQCLPASFVPVLDG